MSLVEQALAARRDPLTLFFRDDDAGWDMPALERLLALFAGRGCPVDLAVIPAVLDDGTAQVLTYWRARHRGIGLHQHGHAHINYEAEGARKSEFGASRPIERQCADIVIGRERLASLLGATDPIFTPPWNRCSAETVARLGGLGFAAYSADRAIACADGLAMVPVSFDWDRARREGDLEGRLAAALAGAETPFGVMLHHATLSTDDLSQLARFLDCIAQHPGASCTPMRALLDLDA